MTVADLRSRVGECVALGARIGAPFDRMVLGWRLDPEVPLCDPPYWLGDARGFPYLVVDVIAWCDAQPADALVLAP